MRRLFTDTLVIAERNLVRLPRAPELLVAFTVQPIMFVLLFRYVFGGAIKTPGFSYADFLIRGSSCRTSPSAASSRRSGSTRTCTRA
jgi:hypothetical protein